MRIAPATFGVLLCGTLCSAGAWAETIRGDFFASAKVVEIAGGTAKVVDGQIVIPKDLTKSPETSPEFISFISDGGDPPKKYVVFNFRSEKPDDEPTPGRSSGELGAALEVIDNPVLGATARLAFNDIISFDQDTTDDLAVQLAVRMPVHGVVSGLGAGDAVSGRFFYRLTPQDAVDALRTVQFQEKLFVSQFDTDSVTTCYGRSEATLTSCSDDGSLADTLGSSSTYLGEKFLFELVWEVELTCGSSAGCQPGVRIDFDETFAPSFRAGPFQNELAISSESGLFGAQITTVPVPGAHVLLLSGLGALVGFGRLRKKAAALVAGAAKR